MGSGLSNYAITYVPGTLTVLEPAITVTNTPVAAINEGDGSVSVEVAAFTHANGVEAPGHFTAVVNWGIAGHTADVGTITQDGSGTYHVSALRPVFAEGGSYAVSVAVSDADAGAGIGQNFSGLSAANDIAVYGSFFIPPDQGSAVGPNHYMELINLVYAIYNKDGTVAVPATPLSTFFANAGIAGLGTAMSDPRIVYDQASQRWFVVVITTESNSNSVLMAVSQTSDPTGAWKAARFVANTTPNNFADYPTIAIDANALYVASNNFLNGTSFDGVSLTTIPKADLLNAAGPVVANRSHFENIVGGGTAGTQPFTLAPVSDFGSRPYGVILAADGFSPAGVIHTYIVNNPGSNAATLSADTPLSVPTYWSNQNGHQPDGSRTLNSTDFRFGSNNVYQVGNDVWVADSILPTAATGTGAYDAIRWYEIDISTDTVLQSGTISDPHHDYLFPSIAANAAGDVVIGFTATGDSTTSDYPGAWYVAGTTTGGVTTFGTPTALRNGSSNYSIVGSGRNRWGDFSAISVDPTNPNAFWVADEAAIPGDPAVTTRTQLWGTQVGEVVFGNTASATGSLTVNEPAITGTAASLAAVNEGDPGAAVEVATFTHANGVEPAGDFTATVNWGIAGHTADAATITQDGSGTYHVSATRPVFAEEGSYTVTVSISEDNASTTVTDTQAVNEPAIVGTSATLAAVNEGDPGAAVEVATFTHANGVEPAGDFTATVNWGITGHTADAATITQDGSGTYHVSATRPVFTEDSSYTISVSISEDNTSTTVSDALTVNEPAISGTAATLAAVNEGDASASVEVATFTHANGVEPAGDFTATVNWGVAGHTADAATVTKDGSGTYHVSATRPVFAEEGNYTVTVSISEDNGSTTVTDTQTVNEPAIVGTSKTLVAVNEGDASASVEVATFTHANGVEAVSGFTATVNWGVTGHTADAATITQDGSGVYHVSATRPVFSEEGSYSVKVTIGEDNGSTVVTDTQAVNEPAISGTSKTLSAVVVGQASATVEVATFTHANGVEPTSAFTAKVNWGIAGHTADTATVTQDGSGVYHVSATRPVFASAATYTVTVSISEDNAATTVTDTQVVNKDSTTTTATASPSAANFGQNITFSATVTANPPGNGTPTGTVDFFDTTTSNDLGPVTLASGAASLNYSTLSVGVHTITVSYSGDPNFLASNTTITVTVGASVYVLDPKASGALSLSGNGSLQVPGLVMVDSSSKTALTGSGQAVLTAGSIRVVGGFSWTSSGAITPAPVTGAASVPDPLAGLPVPSAGASMGSINMSSGTQTINPGSYSGITLSSSAHLILTPGVYYMTGNLNISGSATISVGSGSSPVTGHGVLIYNASGAISISGGGSTNLVAPDQGVYAGILIFQARTNSNTISLSGQGISALNEGSIYAAAALLSTSGQAKPPSAIIVDKLQISGGGGLLAAGSTVGPMATAGGLIDSNLTLYVDHHGANLTTSELARISDAVNTWDQVLAPYGVTITEVNRPTAANLVLDISATSPGGGKADGVLGWYESGQITLIAGWNYYAGNDPSAIRPGQYDFETLVLHELGHALGLGHSANSSSVMYGSLAAGVARRTPTVADLQIGDRDGQRDALTAADYGTVQRMDLSDRAPANAVSTNEGGKADTGSMNASLTQTPARVVGTPLLVGPLPVMDHLVALAVAPTENTRLANNGTPNGTLLVGPGTPAAAEPVAPALRASVPAERPARHDLGRFDFPADDEGLFLIPPARQAESIPARLVEEEWLIPAAVDAFFGDDAMSDDSPGALAAATNLEHDRADRPLLQETALGQPVALALLGLYWGSETRETEAEARRRTQK